MKNSTFLLILLSISTFAQKVNFNSKSLNVQYVQLPSNPIEEKKERTFTTNSNSINIAGFSEVAHDGVLDIHFNYAGVENISWAIKEKRLKINNTHKIVATFNSKGSLRVFNKITRKYHDKKFSIPSRHAKSFSSYNAAKEFSKHLKSDITKKYTKHKVAMINDSRDFINDIYGYPVIKKTDQFLILDSKKHPEYKAHHLYFEKMKTAFSKMNYKEPVSNLEIELQEVITYFTNLVSKYSGGDKKSKKMRYSSYYALAKMYYYLDKPSKTKEYGQKIIDNNYNKKEGRNFIKLGETLIFRLKSNQKNTRHFNVKINKPAKINKPKKVVFNNDVVAYLITKKDTIKATISDKHLLQIDYSVFLKLAKGNTNFKASDCKKLALTNGDMYKVLAFKEAKINGENSSLKFVKVLFESNKISLYLFKNKEFVLVKKNQKGISTLTPSFAFGFNKKLASFCSDCPSLITRTTNNEFKNNTESLLAFCKAYNACK